MRKPPALRPAHFLILASAIRYASQFGLIFILAQLLGPRAVGIFALSLAITSPIFLLAGWGLRQLVLTLARTIGFSTYARARFILAGIALIASVVIAATLQPQNFFVIVLVALFKSAELFVDWASAYLQRALKHWQILTITTANALVSLTGAAISGAITADLNKTVAAYAVLYATSTTLLLPPLLRRSISKIDSKPYVGKDLWRILQSGFPLAISASTTVLIQTMPQYFLAATSDSAAVGHFAALLYLTFFSEIILNGHTQAWIPEARELHKSGRLEIIATLRASTKSAIYSLSVSAAALGAGFFFLSKVLGPYYTLSLQESVPLLGIALFQPVAFYLLTALTVRNQYASHLGSSVVGVVVVAAASAAFVPIGGTTGALWSYTCATVARTLTAIVQSRTLPPRRPR
jgi:O-antigen/teichoic acid export membrane protein